MSAATDAATICDAVARAEAGYDHGAPWDPRRERLNDWLRRDPVVAAAIDRRDAEREARYDAAMARRGWRTS